MNESKYTTRISLPTFVIIASAAILFYSVFNDLGESLYVPAGPGRFLGLTQVYRLVGRLGCNSKGYCYYYIADLATSTFLLLALDRRSCPITNPALTAGPLQQYVLAYYVIDYSEHTVWQGRERLGDHYKSDTKVKSVRSSSKHSK